MNNNSLYKKPCDVLHITVKNKSNYAPIRNKLSN